MNLPSHTNHPTSNQLNFANFPTFSSPTCTSNAYNHTQNSAGNPFYPGYTSSNQAFSTSSSSTPGIVSTSNTVYSVYNPGQIHPAYQLRQQAQVPSSNQIHPAYQLRQQAQVP